MAIVGGGISGLAVARGLQERAGHLAVDVYDAGDAPGGTARTETVEDFSVDLGPNGFLTNVPETLELVSSLGLSEALVTASDAARYRFLWHEGRLEPLPLSPLAFLRTPLLDWRAKFRALREPFIPPGGTPNETVWAFVARRLGPAFADAFVAPMVLGITGGDARRVELASLFPRMAALEAEHGGLFRALFARRLHAMRPGRRRALPAGTTAPGRDVSPSGPAGPGGRLTSLRGGIGALTAHLAATLGERYHPQWPVASLERSDARWRIRRADGLSVEADALVLAVPAWQAASLLRAPAPAVASSLDRIDSSDMTMVAVGYRREDVPHPLDGFGFLAPRGSGLRVLGCLWTSTLFPAQAPSGHVLLRVMLGGDVDAEVSALDDASVEAIVRRDLRAALGIEAAPRMVRQVRWHRAIPQYRPGHAELVDGLDALVREHAPGLHLTGNSYRGVGLNDCVRDAGRVVAALAAL